MGVFMWHGWNRHLGGSGTCQTGESNGLLRLSDAPPGQPVEVKAIEGGRKLCARMAALGIYPGVKLELLCSHCDAPCLVKVRGSTLSLGVGVSRKIMVAQAV